MLGHEVDDGLKRGLKMITLLGMLLVPRAWVIGPGCSAVVTIGDHFIRFGDYRCLIAAHRG